MPGTLSHPEPMSSETQKDFIETAMLLRDRAFHPNTDLSIAAQHMIASGTKLRMNPRSIRDEGPASTLAVFLFLSAIRGAFDRIDTYRDEATKRDFLTITFELPHR